MAGLQHKIKNALDEARILVLGSQVLVGVQFGAVFAPGFGGMPHHAQLLLVSALGLLLATLGLLLAPPAFHRIVEEGRDTVHLLRYIERVMGVALLPFAVGLGADLFIATGRLTGPRGSAAFGIGGTVLALVFWYGIEHLRRASKQHQEVPMPRDEEAAPTKLESTASPAAWCWRRWCRSASACAATSTWSS